MFTAADSTNGLDFYDFGEQLPDKSEGRFPDGNNTWKFFNKPTKGESNSFATDTPDQSTMPKKFVLQQNYPNPFNSTTQIAFSLPSPEKVTLSIFNTIGQKVKTLIDDNFPAGNHSVRWKPEAVPSGLYFYQFTSGAYAVTKKMMLLR
jgi:hypothetical protein